MTHLRLLLLACGMAAVQATASPPTTYRETVPGTRPQLSGLQKSQASLGGALTADAAWKLFPVQWK
jgi:hypothetical protein